MRVKLSPVCQNGPARLRGIPTRRWEYLSKTYRNSTSGDKSDAEGKEECKKIVWHVNYKLRKLLLAGDAERFAF